MWTENSQVKLKQTFPPELNWNQTNNAQVRLCEYNIYTQWISARPVDDSDNSHLLSVRAAELHSFPKLTFCRLRRSEAARWAARARLTGPHTASASDWRLCAWIACNWYQLLLQLHLEAHQNSYNSCLKLLRRAQAQFSQLQGFLLGECLYQRRTVASHSFPLGL